jgi:predicted NBD/HSP70 family sugar kinase
MNQRLLLDRLFSGGPATRPQLARDTGLSQPTVFAALADLEKAVLVRPCGRPEAAHGRPAMLYEANPAAGSVVGVDVGREWLHLLVTDLAGHQLAQLDVRNTARGAHALVDSVGRAVTEVTGVAGVEPASVTHTVIGSPGVFDPARGRVAFAANLPGWQRAGLADALAERLGDSLTIDNDANLAALGEHAYGAARDVRHFAYLTIGTGVGLGLVLDGRLYRGFTGAAGEVGYLPIGDDVPPARPTRRRRGMLEEALAADAVVGYAKASGMSGVRTAEQVFAAARDGDARAQRAVEAEATRLAQLVASIAAFIDPELIVVGGGIGQNLDLLEHPMRATLARLTPIQTRLVPGQLGRTAVVRGAVAIGIDRAKEIIFTERRSLRPRGADQSLARRD